MLSGSSTHTYNCSLLSSSSAPPPPPPSLGVLLGAGFGEFLIFEKMVFER